ncbi:purine and uridine phosphorylase [Daldinia vernicosa]|uniref:purine and uridine phosphorylase n=1 Tax=Daldinia vernicosa TaxID=114800 RepID=UPI00200836A3|nr:purine and uridine phosphorylase [Daldinia vernicosa]KAI0846396.1 purine and uridine phosphorylase [Daldinia vernicosa]
MEDLQPENYRIIWIAPLEIEAQAALHMLDHRHTGRFPMARGDDYVFQAGDMCGHNVVIATLPAGQEYGSGSAAALASQAKKFFPNFWFGLLVGVAAGIPDLKQDPPRDIRLGDVLVSIPDMDRPGTVAYDLGREIGGDTLQLLRHGYVLAQTEQVVRSAIGSIKLDSPEESRLFLPFYENMKNKKHAKGTFIDPGQDRDNFYQLGDDGIEHIVERPKRPASERTRVWYGPIGSGEKLMRSASKRDKLRDEHGIIGLEMEAAGIMNRLNVGVIRGTCDYADDHKNKDWQPYAAAIAAAYAKALLSQIPPSQPPNRPVPPGRDLYDSPANNGRGRGYTAKSPAFNNNESRREHGNPDNITEDVSDRGTITFSGRGNQNIGSGSISIGGAQHIS